MLAGQAAERAAPPDLTQQAGTAPADTGPPVPRVSFMEHLPLGPKFPSHLGCLSSSFPYPPPPVVQAAHHPAPAEDAMKILTYF